jgi:hypothetical protein
VQRLDSRNFLLLQGFLMIGPVLHYWYGLNARIVPGAGTGAALIRLVSCTRVEPPSFETLVVCTLAADMLVQVVYIPKPVRT